MVIRSSYWSYRIGNEPQDFEVSSSEIEITQVRPERTFSCYSARFARRLILKAPPPLRATGKGRKRNPWNKRAQRKNDLLKKPAEARGKEHPKQEEHRKGRLVCLSGLIPEKRYAAASPPLHGMTGSRFGMGTGALVTRMEGDGSIPA